MKKSQFAATVAAAALALPGCAGYSKVFKTDRSSALAVTAQQKALAETQSRLRGQPVEQLGRYLDAADAARRRLAGDPKNTLLQSDYNFAVARVMDLVSEQKLAPWDKAVVAPSASGAPWRLRLKPPFPEEKYSPRYFDFTSSDRYNFRGKLVGERVQKLGLGAPMIVVGRDIDYLRYDPFAQGKHVYYGLTSVINFKGKDAQIDLLDPLARENVTLDGRTYPLAGDFQGPLALALAELEPRKRELLAMFKPQAFEGTMRLSRLQPFSPGKIPVVFVHGLSNSPATWAPLVEFLRGDPVIREHYQFWFFAYPSGLPYPLVAASLREQLAAIRKMYPGLKDVVVVGHSMGGMISRLLITDSGTHLWDTYFTKPPSQIPLTPESRKILTDSLIFKSVPNISRVVFVSASHRGSDKAIDFWGKLGARIIGQPLSETKTYAEAMPYVRPEALARSKGRFPNSVDLLDPDNLTVTEVNKLPTRPGVPFHSLMGDRGKGGFLDKTRPQSSDGIVPYWSSHMEGAASERIIPSGHWSHLHPLGMSEIKRILLEHLDR